MVTPIRVVFFGTPAFAVPTLSALLDSPCQVVAVVTQPDRPRGRGQRVRPAAVKTEATAAGLTVLQPERLRDTDFRVVLEGLAPDLGVVAAYGKLLPEELLALPRLGLINVHASLLPRWRGAAPVHRAVLAGDETTGVTIMRVIKPLDAGPTLARVECAIGPNETSADVESRLAVLGARLLVGTITAMATGTVAEHPQDDLAATYAPRLERRESEIDWNRPALAVHNQIRGLQPWPLAVATFLGLRTALLGSFVVDDHPRDVTPGTVSAVSADGIEVATRHGAVCVRLLQIAGKPPTEAAAFLRGHPVRTGDAFGPVGPAAT